MNQTYSQVAFFQQLKNAIPSYTSLVDEIASVLQIGMDSAYRRIRGEKLLDFNEIELLCRRFNFSLDRFFSHRSNAILFQGNLNTYQDNSFMLWMEDVLAQLNHVNSFSKKHIYWLVKDMPPFHHYYFQELASFKFFFWMKSILFNERFKTAKFTVKTELYDQYKQITQEILRAYYNVPTTEIWNLEGINTTLSQIDLYHEMGIMYSTEDTIQLYQRMLDVVDHLEHMAERGRKSLPGNPAAEGAPYHFFVNGFIIGDNTFMGVLDEIKITYLNHSVIYFLGTSDPIFNEGMFRNLDNLIKKSTQISIVGEKERKQFFNKLKRNIEERLQKLVGYHPPLPINTIR